MANDLKMQMYEAQAMLIERDKELQEAKREIQQLRLDNEQQRIDQTIAATVKKFEEFATQLSATLKIVEEERQAKTKLEQSLNERVGVVETKVEEMTVLCTYLQRRIDEQSGEIENQKAGQLKKAALVEKVNEETKNISQKTIKPGPIAEFSELKKEIAELRKIIQDLSLNTSKGATTVASAKEASAEKDDDFDLFGSAEEDSDVEERLKAYNAKKGAKPGPIAKSSVILDVKPWDDETNLEEMEKLVRSIKMDGLVWEGAKLIPIGYGIKKLQIICVIEDLKVSVDGLTEKIAGDFEDHVQSVGIAAFNKI